MTNDNNAYDSDNIFAKILRGELPAHKVYEDEAVLAFLDIMPVADGHTLVIPKTTARTLLDIEASELKALIVRVQKIAITLKQVMKADGLTVEQFNEAASGQTVFHLHFHLIPRWSGDSPKPHAAEMAPQDKLAQLAEKIGAALG